MQGLTVFAPFLGILGLIIAYLIYIYVKKQVDIKEQIHLNITPLVNRKII